MAYTTSPIANRLGINQGWQNHILPLGPNLSTHAMITYLKSYLVLKEYLNFYQINIISLNIKSILATTKLFQLSIFKTVKQDYRKRYYNWHPTYNFVKPNLYSQVVQTPKSVIKLLELKNATYIKSPISQKFLRSSSYLYKKTSLTHLKPVLKINNINLWTYFRSWRKFNSLPYFRSNVSSQTLFNTIHKSSPKQLDLIKLFSLSKTQSNWQFRYIYNVSQIKNKFMKILTHFNLNNVNKILVPCLKKWFSFNFMNQHTLLKSFLTPSRKDILNLKSLYYYNYIKNLNITRNLKLISNHNQTITRNQLSLPNIRTLGQVNTGKLLYDTKLKYFLESYIKRLSGLSIIAKIKNLSSDVLLKSAYYELKNKNRLRQVAKHHFFKRLLFAFIGVQRFMAAQMIADLIANELSIPRKHTNLLREINSVFDLVRSQGIIGYKFIIDGKLNGRLKSRKQLIKIKGKDRLPVQEFNKRIVYGLSTSYTYTGLFGVRVWLFY